MKPLETSQRVLTWLCGVPPHESDSKRQKIEYIAFTASFIIFISILLICSSVFIYQNVSVNLEETLFSLFHTIASLQMLYQCISTILLRRKLIAIFDNLMKIYNDNIQEDSFHLLKQTNEKCEWLWPIFFKYILGGFFIVTPTMAAVSVLYSYISSGHFDVKQAYHPGRYVLPWNQSTPLGYSLEIGFNIVAGETYFLSNGTLLILFTSMCLHHQTFYKMFRNETMKLNHCDEQRNDAEHFCKMIRFHISVKDWFLESAAAYSTFVLIVLISSMLFLACCVFQLDLQKRHLDFGIIIICMALISGTVILFVYCYLGKVSTESYEKMAECLYDCKWHELDLKYQKYILIMMANAQRPIYYHGFGVAVLNLETFLTMIRAVYSYYMIFKTLTSN